MDMQQHDALERDKGIFSASTRLSTEKKVEVSQQGISDRKASKNSPSL
jgi:hypothetical protein